jgi:DinB superfamily
LNSFAAAASDLEKTVAQVQPLLGKVTEQEASRRPQPGKWSKKEILGHLLDSASNNHQRFVRAALQRELTFPGYSQDAMVELQRFNEMTWEFLITFWASYNLFLANVLSALPADAAPVQCAIGKNPPATLEWIAQDYVAHLKHHLNQILGKMFETSYGKTA